MSRSGLPRVIFIQLASPGRDVPAVIGTEAIHYVDGRYSRDRVINGIYDRYYRDYLANGYKLLGYGVPGDYSNKIYALR